LTKPDQKTESIGKLWFYLMLLVLAGALDGLSTIIGLKIGLSERHPLFLHYPWIATELLMGLITFIYLFKWAPLIFRTALIQGLIVFSFAPGILNTLLILAVIL
jgi:hypothetical protein